MNDNKQKKDKRIFSTAETTLLVIMALIIGLSIGNLFNKTNIVSKNMSSNDQYLDEFIQNYEFILNNYYEEINKEDLVNSAIAGMMESLDDPYSMYFNEEESDNFSITLNGSYKGIGIQIMKEETGYMLITSVFKNSPASQSGLKAGDKIVSIDGKSAIEMSASDFSSIIRDSEKTSFNIEIIRDEETLKINLNKSEVVLSSVTSEIYEIENKKIGYIYIGIFANNTYAQFKDELDKVEKEDITSLIIDVRGNTGGHLTAVDNILDLFLNKDQIMYQFEQNGKITKVYGTGKENKSYEIILLGDGVSASASEVLISGLRENLDSIFIGKKTYGKGTVQELVTLSDGTQYKLTVKKWLTPLGNWINSTEGLLPDIEINLSDKYYETYEEADDTQLQKALEYLENK